MPHQVLNAVELPRVAPDGELQLVALGSERLHDRPWLRLDSVTGDLATADSHSVLAEINIRSRCVSPIDCSGSFRARLARRPRPERRDDFLNFPLSAMAGSSRDGGNSPRSGEEQAGRAVGVEYRRPKRLEQRRV